MDGARLQALIEVLSLLVTGTTLKITKIESLCSCVPAEILTGHVPITSREGYRLGQLTRWKSLVE
jgi:hypothetical protein